jgi:putative chitinase
MTMPIESGKLSRMSPRLRDKESGAPTARCALYATVLSNAYGIAVLDPGLRLYNFLGQVAEETGGFSSLVESTTYSSPERLVKLFSNVHGLDHAKRLIAEGPQATANTIYAGKLGNGDPASGDGWRFRGRGFLQITGRQNYRDIGRLIGLDLEENPEQLAQPAPAARAAALFWLKRNINTPADVDDVGMVTQLVNGGARQGLTERRAWREKAEACFA